MSEKPTYEELERRVWELEQAESDRKQAEEALRRSETKYRHLVESLERDYIIYSHDTQGIFTYLSPSIVNVLGYTQDEFMGHYAEYMTDSPVNKDVEHHTAAGLRGEKQLPYEAEFWHKDGSRRLLETTEVPVFDSKGNVLGIEGIVKDITKSKRAEEERRTLEEQLWRARKAESLGRMAGAIAHRFNNQLFVVMANLEMALMDLPTDAPQHRHLTVALQATKRSAETSGLMLTYLGQSTDKGEPMDLSDVCRRNLPSLQGVIAAGIVLETALMDAGPIIRASSAQIQHVLTHLITNAVEAIGDSGGRIVLATGTMLADEIPKSNLSPPDWKPAQDSYAWLAVTDSGCGIARADLDKIFDPFFTTKFTGRGLGLAVILGIVRQRSGASSVESGKGKGTTVRVFFPLVDDAVPPVAQKETAVQPMAEGNSVLLVEDDDLVRDITERSLRFLGRSVIAVSSGTEALDLFNRHRDEIGCVITDLTMPGMDGWETIAALRRIDTDIPIILVSGYDEADVMGGGQSERPQAFLHKPFMLADLKAALAAVGKEAEKHE